MVIKLGFFLLGLVITTASIWILMDSFRVVKKAIRTKNYRLLSGGPNFWKDRFGANYWIFKGTALFFGGFYTLYFSLNGPEVPILKDILIYFLVSTSFLYMILEIFLSIFLYKKEKNKK